MSMKKSTVKQVIPAVVKQSVANSFLVDFSFSIAIMFLQTFLASDKVKLTKLEKDTIMNAVKIVRLRYKP